jgi:hypothetical protein
VKQKDTSLSQAPASRTGKAISKTADAMAFTPVLAGWLQDFEWGAAKDFPDLEGLGQVQHFERAGPKACLRS